MASGAGCILSAYMGCTWCRTAHRCTSSWVSIQGSGRRWFLLTLGYGNGAEGRLAADDGAAPTRSEARRVSSSAVRTYCCFPCGGATRWRSAPAVAASALLADVSGLAPYDLLCSTQTPCRGDVHYFVPNNLLRLALLGQTCSRAHCKLLERRSAAESCALEESRALTLIWCSCGWTRPSSRRQGCQQGGPRAAALQRSSRRAAPTAQPSGPAPPTR